MTDFTDDPRWVKIVDEQRAALPPPVQLVVPCEFCGHAQHDGRRCLRLTDEDEGCACSYPDPGNVADATWSSVPLDAE